MPGPYRTNACLFGICVINVNNIAISRFKKSVLTSRGGGIIKTFTPQRHGGSKMLKMPLIISGSSQLVLVSTNLHILHR